MRAPGSRVTDLVTSHTHACVIVTPPLFKFSNRKLSVLIVRFDWHDVKRASRRFYFKFFCFGVSLGGVISCHFDRKKHRDSLPANGDGGHSVALFLVSCWPPLSAQGCLTTLLCLQMECRKLSPQSCVASPSWTPMMAIRIVEQLPITNLLFFHYFRLLLQIALDAVHYVFLKAHCNCPESTFLPAYCVCVS